MKTILLQCSLAIGFTHAATATRRDPGIFQAGILPLPSNIPIAQPGGVSPEQALLVATPPSTAGGATLKLPLKSSNPNPQIKDTEKQLGKFGAEPEDQPPPLPPPSLFLQLPSDNPHNLYWLPTGEELNGLVDEERTMTEEQQKKDAEQAEQDKEEKTKEITEENNEEEKEEEELQKEDPLEKEAPVHGLRPFGWRPQLGVTPPSTDYSNLNSDAFTTLLELNHGSTHRKLLVRRKMGLRGKAGETPQPSMAQSWNMMQATTPIDDKEAGYVMPALKPDGDVEIPTDSFDTTGKGGEKDEEDAEVKEIEGEATTDELGAAASVISDIKNGEKMDKVAFNR